MGSGAFGTRYEHGHQEQPQGHIEQTNLVVDEDFDTETTERAGKVTVMPRYLLCNDTEAATVLLHRACSSGGHCAPHTVATNNDHAVEFMADVSIMSIIVALTSFPQILQNEREWKNRNALLTSVFGSSPSTKFAAWRLVNSEICKLGFSIFSFL